MHWDKTQNLKKFLTDKINGTKNALFFLSRAPTYQSFTFNLRFLYELRFVSLKLCVRFFIFDSVPFLLKVVSATFLLVCFLDLNESPCQTRENVFYFTSKTFFVLEKIKF